MAERVRVVIVDDSESTRAMLREALDLDDTIEVVGEAGGGREAVRLAAEARPDVILMDIRMDDVDGIEATRVISSARPQARVIALTWSDDPMTARAMLEAGAVGYVVKGGTIEELIEAIRRAASGTVSLDPRVRPLVSPT
ncbi:MAG TPA: response regulator transcription factor [Actinomycetota bacterium]|nr:response regulator transcription factor [Actinomycetota bacterium]